MKKASLLPLALLVSLTSQQAVAQQSHGVVDIPVGQLQAAYRASFGRNPDLGNYGQLALAINRSRSQYFPGAAGGFWNGVINENIDDRSKDAYHIVTIGQAPFPDNPQLMPVRALAALYLSAIGRPPNFADYRSLALSIDRYRVQNAHYAGGFWNGEQADTDKGAGYGIVWVASANEPQLIPAAQLVASFERRAQRTPNLTLYGDMALAVTGWIEDHQKGLALGGFWNGEKADSDQGPVYGIVLVR